MSDKRFNQVLLSFENDLKRKLDQKCPSTQEKSLFLSKTFKFFDIQNRGSITCDQFKRAVQKLGVVLPTGSRDNDLDMIFSHYDESGDGAIDYKELAKALEAKHSDAADKIVQAARDQRQVAPQQVQQ